MLLEDVLTALIVLMASIFLIGVPVYNFLKIHLPKKPNALLDAKERLERARIDVEAARLNKEAEKLYEELYKETLQDEDKSQQEKNK